jgi:phage gp46-like protein
MDFLLETDGGQVFMTFNSVDNIRNNILLSLIVRKGTFFLDYNFGSQLYELNNNSFESCNLAVSYCKSALQWMIKIQRVIQFDVSAVPFKNGISLRCVATLPDKSAVSYDHFVRIA